MELLRVTNIKSDVARYYRDGTRISRQEYENTKRRACRLECFMCLTSRTHYREYVQVRTK